MKSANKDAEMKSNPKIQKAIIIKILASGARVSLENGETAWLPAREVYPDFKPFHDFRVRGKNLEGQEIDVIEIFDPIIKKGKVVSHIRTANDPWETITSWANGTIKVMEVIAQTPERVIGSIPPGITAEIPLDPFKKALNIPSWQRFGMPLVGDEVAGFFREDGIDESTRIVTLDYAGLIQSSVSVEDILSISNGITKQIMPELFGKNFRYPKSHDSSQEIIATQQIKNILLVDNDSTFLHSLESYLTIRGFHVIARETFDDAIHEIEIDGDNIDLAIIDIHIPKNASAASMHNDTETIDHLGLSIAKILSTKYRCAIVVITGQDMDPHDNKIKESLDIQISNFLEKPFNVEDLYHALDAYRYPRRPLSYFLGDLKTIDEPQQEEIEIPPHNLQIVMDSLREDINAEAVVLFSLNPTTYAVRIEASSDPIGAYSTPRPNLHLSPVQDAAIDGEVILSTDASQLDQFPKHRYLRRAYNYKSSIGINVKVRHTSSVGYALFAFHKDANQFSHYRHLGRMKIAAREITYIQTIKATEKELIQMKPFELMGKTYGSMAHELTHLFSNEFLLADIESDITSNKPSSALNRINQLRHMSNQASKILRTFRHMARGQLDDIIDFNLLEALENIWRTFNDQAKIMQVDLGFQNNTNDECIVHMRETGFNLIVYNLLLNALQQIQRFQKVKEYTGEILIEIINKTDDKGTRWGIIRIHDNGPGIHRRDFERVFDIHYTTKEHGCGMGLDISRSIARSVVLNGEKGYVVISRSVLLAGSTFEVSLPIK